MKMRALGALLAAGLEAMAGCGTLEIGHSHAADPSPASSTAPSAVPERATSPTDVSAFEAMVYMDKDGHQFPYRLLRPQNYDPSVKYPLVLVRHGSGGEGTDNVRQMGGVERLLGRPDLRTRFPCFSVVPQCPLGMNWSGRRRAARTDSAPASQPAFEPLALVADILARTRADNTIDADRVYVLGVSMGGAGTWSMLARHPDLFAAGVPICGTGDPATAKAIAGAQVPLWVWHGQIDNTVPVER